MEHRECYTADALDRAWRSIGVSDIGVSDIGVATNGNKKALFVTLVDHVP